MAYTHGHHESVLRSHTWRTAENSSGYLIPHLRAGMSVLDVGCGPGTITADLARLVGPGEVIGMDASADVIAQARAHADGLGLTNVEFVVGDLFEPDLESERFDVVHLHQVLQHLGDPEAALLALRRVLRPDGVLAARDSDYGAFTWAPADPRLDRWLELYLDITGRNGHDVWIGPRLPALARAAGFDRITVSSSTWTYADLQSREWWGRLWADRVRYSRLAEQALEYGMSDADELESIADAFLGWSASEDAVFVVTHVEVLARG